MAGLLQQKQSQKYIWAEIVQKSRGKVKPHLSPVQDAQWPSKSSDWGDQEGQSGEGVRARQVPQVLPWGLLSAQDQPSCITGTGRWHSSGLLWGRMWH